MKICLKIWLPILFSSVLNAQQSLPDSLVQMLQHASNDSLRFLASNAAYNYFEEINRDSAIYYADQCLVLAQKNNKKIEEADQLVSKSYQLINLGRYAEALPCFFMAFRIAEDPRSENKAWIYNDGLSPQKERLLILSYTHHMFAALMSSVENIGQMIIHYNEAKRLAKEIGGINGTFRISLADMNLGFAYLRLNKLDSAMMFEKEAKELLASTGKKKYISLILFNMGEITLKNGDTTAAVKLYHDAIQSAIEQENFSSLARIFMSLSGLYILQNKKDSSLIYSVKMMETLMKIGAEATNDMNIGVAYQNLYYSYRLKNQFDSAFKYQTLAMATKDSLNKVRINNLTEFQSLTFSEQLRLQNIEKEKTLYQSKVRSYFLLGGLGVLLLLAVIFYSNNRQMKKAKMKVEKAYVNLKATQQQLVQSEKMASLGELTAGIAHEIQNPLNFVNNFSEVNKELLIEMNEEIKNRNYDEVKTIAKDLTDNEEKINHHGKRADAIVKGMLQHSRNSSGRKEPTDINVLADEYLRLAYHGLRAKDKTFNAKFETDFDPSVGKINVVSQDIGRVILNLINNAFYAVSEKKKIPQPPKGGVEYEPTVIVSTKKVNGKVEIKVSDNGNGIPQKVLDKIFQPFFTTKPTGQGTGLGLSLSYDIVKAHGSELQVQTKENEGSIFSFQII
jgi:signal transduction histidine kinase